MYSRVGPAVIRIRISTNFYDSFCRMRSRITDGSAIRPGPRLRVYVTSWNTGELIALDPVHPEVVPVNAQKQLEAHYDKPFGPVSDSGEKKSDPVLSGQAAQV